MLTVARDKEKTPKLKRPRGRPCKRPMKEIDLENENKAIKASFIALNINLEQSVSYRTRSRK